jgi:hypothetical protein
MAGGATLAFAGPSLAGPPGTDPRFELSFQAPAGCPTSEQVRVEIADLIGERTNPVTAKTIAAVAAVVAVPDGYELTLSLRDGESTRQRRMHAPTCEELARAAALIVAIAVDPAVLERHDLATDESLGNAPKDAPRSSCHCRLTELIEPFSTSPRCPPSPVCAPPPTPEKPLPELPSRYRFGFGAKGSVGALPQVSLGPLVFGAYQGGALRVELAASLQSAQASVAGTGGTGDFDLARLAARGCWLVAKTSWSAGPCVAVEGGVLTAKGTGVAQPHRQTAKWFGSTVGALFEVQVVENAYLTLSGDLGLPWFEDRFTLDGDAVFSPGIYGGAGVGLAAGWR